MCTLFVGSTQSVASFSRWKAEDSPSKADKKEGDVTSNASRAARKLLDLLGANQKLKAMVARLEDDLATSRTDLIAAVERAVEAEGLVEKAETVRGGDVRGKGYQQEGGARRTHGHAARVRGGGPSAAKYQRYQR